MVESFLQLYRFFTKIDPVAAEIFLGLASLLVSVFIYMVYRQQVALKRLELRPILHTNQYRIASGTSELSNPGIVIKLSNHGDGSATTMTGKITISPVRIDGLDTKFGLLRFWLHQRLPRSASEWTRLTAPDDSDNNNGHTWEEIYGSKIGPRETEEYHIPFKLNTNMNIWPDFLSQYRSQLTFWRTKNPHIYGFTSAMTELTTSSKDGEANEAVEQHYRLKICIEHGNPAGYHGTEPVFDYIIPPRDDQTLEEALNAGRPYEEFRDNPAGYLDDVLVHHNN
jgi:hypothetical protein